MSEPEIVNWTCGEHPFQLRIGEAEALDDLTPAGMADFLWRCRVGVERGSLRYSTVRQREVIDCIRLGLIGGGMASDEARKLTLRGWQEAPFEELVTICWTIGTACLAGKEHDQPEKPAAARTKRTRKSASVSQSSTETAP